MNAVPSRGWGQDFRMNFMQFIKSLEDVLYEVMSWLVFYPLTLWRTLTHPFEMMEYADTELSDRDDQRYSDTLNPPLFLLLSLLLSHGLELAIVGDDPLVKNNHGLASLIHDETTLLIFRLVTFSIYPLIMSVQLLRLQRAKLTRDSLQMPFYSQCYIAAPFALLLGLGATLVQMGEQALILIGGAVVVSTLILYGTIQSIWFANKLEVSRMRGFLTASRGMIECLLILGILAFLLR